MDWQTPLKFQQTDFVKRLRSGLNQLLFCQLENHFSELVIISEPDLKPLREAAWLVTEKQKNLDSVHEVFLKNLAGKLGEEAISKQLNDLLSRANYKDLIRANDKKSFNARQWKIFITYIKAYQYLEQFLPVNLFPVGRLRLSSNPSASLQVKVAQGSAETVRWAVTREDVKRNAVIVCVLVSEEVDEAQANYHLVLSGFLPTYLIEVNEDETSIGLENLLYTGGLRGFLQVLQAEADESRQQSSKPTGPETSKSTETPATIQIGTWEYPLSIEQISRLKEAIQELLNRHQAAKPQQDSPAISKRSSMLASLWNGVLKQIQPATTQAILRKHSRLLSFDGERAQIGISSEALFSMNPKWLLKVEEAFTELLGREIEVNVEVMGG